VTKAKETFTFTNRMNLTVLTGRSARDLAEFLEYLKVAPGSVIYHHTHHFIQQHQYLSPEPPNDFAYWVTNVLQENILGEQLAAIDVIQFPTITSLQEKLVKTVENYLNRNPNLRTAPSGEEFNFMRSITFILPTDCRADTLTEFRDALKGISVQSLYFHIFEARLRIGRISNDFSLWLEGSLGEQRLAQSIASLDPYTHTLEGLRQTIIRMINKRLEETGHA
jgi:hydroxymethylpyrimidine pyrophosphatase-like HAD family hydrolase